MSGTPSLAPPLVPKPPEHLRLKLVMTELYHGVHGISRRCEKLSPSEMANPALQEGPLATAPLVTQKKQINFGMVAPVATRTDPDLATLERTNEPST